MTVTIHYRPSSMTETRAAIYQWAISASVKSPAILRRGDSLHFLPPAETPATNKREADRDYDDTHHIGRLRAIAIRIRGRAIEAHEVIYGADTFVVTKKTGAVLEPISAA